jgi:hypothetical protein
MHEAVCVVLGNRLVGIGVVALVLASAGAGALFGELPGAQPLNSSRAADAVSVSRLPNHFVFPLLGKEVHSIAGSDIGQIAEVLVDGWGQPRAVVVNFGGFLGIGMREVAVDWRALRFYKSGKREVAVAAVDPIQLARAPQYKADDQSVSVVSPPDTGYGP